MWYLLVFDFWVYWLCIELWLAMFVYICHLYLFCFVTFTCVESWSVTCLSLWFYSLLGCVFCVTLQSSADQLCSQVCRWCYGSVVIVYLIVIIIIHYRLWLSSVSHCSISGCDWVVYLIVIIIDYLCTLCYSLLINFCPWRVGWWIMHISLLTDQRVISTTMISNAIEYLTRKLI